MLHRYHNIWMLLFAGLVEKNIIPTGNQIPNTPPHAQHVLKEKPLISTGNQIPSTPILPQQVLKEKHVIPTGNQIPSTPLLANMERKSSEPAGTSAFSVNEYYYCYITDAISSASLHPFSLCNVKVINSPVSTFDIFLILH